MTYTSRRTRQNKLFTTNPVVASGYGNQTVTREVTDPNRTASKWREVFDTNTFNSNPDPVMFWGWNADRAAGSGDASEPAWHMGFEADYWESPTSRVCEWYVQLIRTDNTSLRPIGLNTSRDPAKDWARVWVTIGTDAADSQFYVVRNSGANPMLFSVDNNYVQVCRPLLLPAPSTTNANNLIQISSNGTGLASLDFNGKWQWVHSPSTGRIHLLDIANGAREAFTIRPGSTSNNSYAEFQCTPYFYNAYATTASAGANGALPATVQGYFQFVDADGILRKVPFYV